MTAREKIKQCSNSIFVSEQSELVDRLVNAFYEYTQEAIKADRINTTNYAEIKNKSWDNSYSNDEHEMYHENGDLHTFSIDKNSIINAPNIELK